MFKSSIEHVAEFQLDVINSDQLLLWIWYADKIPPHIGCSINGSYFSLKSTGKDVLIPAEKVNGIIIRKSIPTLLISSDISMETIKLAHAFDAYDLASADGVSCLQPILDLLKTPSDIKQIKDLIFYLESQERIKHIFGVNLKADYSGLLEYGQKEIKERLLQLNHVKRR
jgi:hypothetical protein